MKIRMNTIINPLKITDTWLGLTVTMLLIVAQFDLSTSSILSKSIRKTPCSEF
jgi:hypothetical protein